MLYLTQVALAGEHIDRVLDIDPQTVNPPRPEVNFHDSSFWAQGITIGGSFNY